MTVQIPEAMAKKIAAHKRKWAEEFTYDDKARHHILDYCGPFIVSTAMFQSPLWAIPGSPSSPEDVCIGMLQQYAREALSAYVSNAQMATPAAKRARLSKVAEVADLLRNIADEPMMWPNKNFSCDLHTIAERYRVRARLGFDHPLHRVHDPILLMFALCALRWQWAETGRKPGKGNSRATRFLKAAVNPVMEIARVRLGIEAARCLDDDRARYLIKQMLSGRFGDAISIASAGDPISIAIAGMRLQHETASHRA